MRRRNMAVFRRRRFRLFGGVIDQLSADNPEIDTKWTISALEERMNRREGDCRSQYESAGTDVVSRVL